MNVSLLHTISTNIMKNINITINRLDYKNPSCRNSYSILPTLNNINDINDINEVSQIIISGDFQEIMKQIPKSYNFKSLNYSDGSTKMSVSFNTFWMDSNTGDQNETAYKNRIKVINKLNQLGF
jgi:hypothetical protein